MKFYIFLLFANFIWIIKKSEIWHMDEAKKKKNPTELLGRF